MAKPRYIRCEDALQFLADALRTAPKSKLRHTYLEAALMTYYAGLLNAHRFNVRDDRRGRPPRESAKTLALMKELQARLDGGEKPTPAARELLRARGFAGEVKGRADHLVRLHGRKQRAKTNN
jgi:hypothetical protein